MKTGEVDKLMNKQRQMIKTISSLMKPIGGRGVVYRCMPYNQETGKSRLLNSEGNVAGTGDILPVDSFTSTSRNPLKALRFAGIEGDILEIQVDEDTRGISMSTADTFHDEEETLLDAGQSLEIVDVIEGSKVSHRFISNVRYIKAKMHAR